MRLLLVINSNLG